MKIEVGKKYLNGYGDVVEITSHSSDGRYPITGTWDGAAHTYTSDGVFDVHAPGHPADLVSELGNSLRVYTAEGEGHCLGSIAVVVATSPEQAADLLSAAMAKEGVPQTVKPEQMKLLPTNEPKAVVLFNGDY